MPLILLTNDDGMDAPGLLALERALKELGEVWTIAPNVERSACGRAVTLRRPLRVTECGERRMAVDGTPADCVLLATRWYLERRPDLVVSGINDGYNIGEDLDYSGTVAAAAEGALQGAASSVALSVKAGADPAAFERAAELMARLAPQLFERPLPRETYLNINLPPDPTSRFRWTRQGNPLGPGEVEEGLDPRGLPLLWIGNRPDEPDPPGDTDRGALAAGCISATLLTLERTYRGSWQAPDVAALDLELETSL